jgi:predicted AAA+ superfamily ATPase
VPVWSRLLRTLHNQRKYSITVTGSNSSLLTREIATELRGRYRDILLMPFSFREYCRFKDIDCSVAAMNTSARGVVAGAFNEWLFNGGYPEICALSDKAARRRLLQNYYETVFYRDIIDRYSVKARDLLDGVMSAVLNGSGELFSVSAYAAQLSRSGISGSKRSIAAYLRYLQEAFFLISSEKFSWSARKRTMNPEKVYLSDTGFNLLSITGSDNRRKLLETAVAGEFFRKGFKTCYYKGKRECDFVVMDDNRPQSAWQVCWCIDDKNEKRETGGLTEAMSALEINEGGIITYESSKKITGMAGGMRLVSALEWFLTG